MAGESTCKELKQRLKELERKIKGLKRAEDKLMESKQEKKIILNRMIEQVRYQDLEMKILWANRAACKAVNLTLEGVLGHYCYEIWAQRGDPCPECSVLKCMETGQAIKRETRFPDGRVCLIWAYPIHDSNGKIVRTMEIALDITESKKTEEALLKRETELAIQSRHLQEVKSALKVLLKHREDDQKEFQESLVSNLEELVFPYLEKLNGAKLDDRYRAYIETIKLNLNEIISPFIGGLSSKFLKFTPSEVQVANLIKHGKNTKDIARMLNLSVETIKFHRKNIREKIGIKNTKANLRTYLLSIQ